MVARLRAAGCVFAEDEARLLLTAAGTSAELASLVDLRVTGTPLEHVLGWAEFAGLRISVDPGVFVPRRRTELLARSAVSLARPGHVLVDLCCGSGAVAAVLAAAVQPLELHLADVDPRAVRCARRNLAAHSAHVHQGDLYDALPATLRGRVDVLVANPPFVPTDEIRLLPPEARDHEPTAALDGGRDGLDVTRRVIRGARAWLAPGGHLLLQTGTDQAEETRALVTSAGLRPRLVHEEQSDAVVVIGAVAR